MRLNVIFFFLSGQFNFLFYINKFKDLLILIFINMESDVDDIISIKQKLNLSIKEKLYENISGIHTQKIIMFFEEIKESCKGLYFLSQNKYLNELNSLELNPFNNSIISFLELMYSEDLKNIFDLMYILASKIKISIEEFLILIPSESLMLYSLYAKEVQQQNDDIEKSTKKNDIPLKTQPLV